MGLAAVRLNKLIEETSSNEFLPSTKIEPAMETMANPATTRTAALLRVTTEAILLPRLLYFESRYFFIPSPFLPYAKLLFFAGTCPAVNANNPRQTLGLLASRGQA